MPAIWSQSRQSQVPQVGPANASGRPTQVAEATTSHSGFDRSSPRKPAREGQSSGIGAPT
eukprot:9580411-Karenia_brevis.AAC.1